MSPPDATPAGDAPGADGPPGPQAACATQWPLATATGAGVPTETLYVRLHVAGVTPSGGADPALHVEIGSGPAATGPAGAGWSYVPATYNPSCLACGADEEWMARVTPPAVGDLRWAGRVAYGAAAFTSCDRSDGGRRGSDDGWAAATAPSLTVSAPAPIRATSLNLRCLVDGWDARLPIIAAGLAAADPELLGFEEACAGGGRDNLAELAAALTARTGRTYTVLRTVTHSSWGGQYDEGIALLTPRRVAASRVVDLPAGAFPRKAVVARVVTAQGPLVFAATHLDHLSTSARVAEAQALLGALADFAEAGEAILVTGDLNEGPTDVTPSVYTTLVSGGYTDLWAALHPGDSGYTFPSSGPTVRIDYGWLRALAPSACARILTAAVGGVYASDHVGLSAAVAR